MWEKFYGNLLCGMITLLFCAFAYAIELSPLESLGYEISSLAVLSGEQGPPPAPSYEPEPSYSAGQAGFGLGAQAAAAAQRRRHQAIQKIEVARAKAKYYVELCKRFLDRAQQIQHAAQQVRQDIYVIGGVNVVDQIAEQYREAEKLFAGFYKESLTVADADLAMSGVYHVADSMKDMLARLQARAVRAGVSGVEDQTIFVPAPEKVRVF